MKTTEANGINFRITAVAVLFALLFLGIAVKVIYLQVFCGEWLSRKAVGQIEKTLTTCGKRGMIYDTRLREMAVSVDTTSVAAYPRQIHDTDETASALSGILQMPPDPLRLKLISRRSFVWIRRQVPPKEEKAVRELKLAGIDFIPDTGRYYPNSTRAGQLIGFTGIDGRGLEGLEFYYNEQLRGKAYQFTVLKDALGKKFEAENEYHAARSSGNNLVLTIDRTIQYIAENALSETLASFSARSGMAIVMDPKTGAILALANGPLFNPNSYRQFTRECWRNRAITDPFEPGSTMKVFSAAAAIESGGCTPNTIFFCENGKYRIGDDVVHDTHPYGWLSLQKIIKHSSNIGAIKMGEMVGPEVLYRTLRDFGFGQKTGIDCPGETPGNLLPFEKWSKIDAGAISFGHGISVSALQLITALSAIANRGVLMKPYVVRAITDPGGGLVRSFGPCKVRQVVSEKTADTVKKMMVSVVQSGGTGVRAALDGYSVCGKTGTSQKLNEKGEYAGDAYIASFMGIVPVENPRVAILVVIDEPRKDHYGGTVAGPAFRKIARETLNYMNVPPQNSTERLTAFLKTRSSVETIRAYPAP
ncbi:cell division protein FtsI [Desulfonema ishimotonii]|uniref:Cell division protein FtsI n=1 Tax=Desulfonema ishimotonii TaxID=45657 RepID=A0A401FYD1_9BACT|nr:penicillin-binding protein 2 [Desulfonema ishimotonii]GBC61979.1 cell division protein FtsI [Desulfonema ishimotonii]